MMLELGLDTTFTPAEQRTQEWYDLRLGKVTASRMGDVMAKTKTGYAAVRATYMSELICERLTGQKADRFVNRAMIWGTEKEPIARDAYVALTGFDVTETGFIPHPAIENFGASPDGLIGDTGLIEIKCPSTATHIETVLNGVIDRKYILQMQVQMACTNRDWCDFVSFDPRMPEGMDLWMCRVGRDDSLIQEIEDETAAFLEEIEEKIEALRSRFSTHHAAANAV